MTSSLVAQPPPPSPQPPPQPPSFKAPSSSDFDIPPMFPGTPFEWLDKPVIQLLFAAVLVAGFFFLATKAVSLVPGRLQYTAEKFHGIVRDQIARDNIGPDFRK